jgi:hypothetical protein
MKDDNLKLKHQLYIASPVEYGNVYAGQTRPALMNITVTSDHINQKSAAAEHRINWVIVSSSWPKNPYLGKQKNSSSTQTWI